MLIISLQSGIVRCSNSEEVLRDEEKINNNENTHIQKNEVVPVHDRESITVKFKTCNGAGGTRLQYLLLEDLLLWAEEKVARSENIEGITCSWLVATHQLLRSPNIHIYPLVEVCIRADVWEQLFPCRTL